jgi:glyoxylase-like metal-dependent hydrolase (beta-lactamase superfamily II)
MPEPPVRFKRVETAPYGTNAYIIFHSSGKESLLVDAPGEAGRILEELDGTRLQTILLTHGHFDHTGSLRELADRLGVPVAAHAADAGRLPVKPDTFLNDGDSISLGKRSMTVLHTPGHTPGSLCFLTDGILFSGDTLFPAGPGRTGTPDAFRQILDSLKHKIFTLPDETRILPGHGEPTVLKKEKSEFAQFAGREHSPRLCGDVLWLSS